GSADREGDRLGHPLSTRLRMAILPRAGARDRSAEARDGGLSMGRYVFKLPDVGEGTAEAEIVAWHVKVGDTIHEDQNMVDVMTDKATVEMTSPVSGKVIALHGEPGAMAAVGSALVELEVEGAGNVKAGAAAPAPKAEAPKPAAPKAEAKPEPKKEDVKPAATAPAMHAAAKPAF